jgi:TATA-box binding protein (TBP) (component of TFIID and TFIIIB)
MPVGDEQVYTAVCSFLKQLKLDYAVKEEEYCDHLYIKSGALKADICVYNSGKIVVGGQDSKLKQILEDAKASLMTGNLDATNILPFEIENFPETIKDRIPECDDVVIKLIHEAIRAYSSDRDIVNSCV